MKCVPDSSRAVRYSIAYNRKVISCCRFRSSPILKQRSRIRADLRITTLCPTTPPTAAAIIRFGGTGTHFNVNSFAKFTTVRQYSLQLNAATGTLPSGAFPGGISSAQLTTANSLAALLGGVAD